MATSNSPLTALCSKKVYFEQIWLKIGIENCQWKLPTIQQSLCNDLCYTWPSPVMASCKLGFTVDQHACISNFHTTFGANLPLRISTTCKKRFMGYNKSIHVWSYITLEFIVI